MKNGGTPLFSPKNKCVLNDSKWPETHFGNFFFVCEKLRILPPSPGCEILHTFFF